MRESDDFVGREAEVRDLCSLLTAGRSAVIVGAPGVGKSALAAAVLSRLRNAAVAVHGLRLAQHVPLAPFWPVVGRVTQRQEVQRRLRAAGPRALLVENAQWVDAESAVVVQELTRHRPTLATWRLGDGPASRADALADHLDADVIRVDALPDRLLATMVGRRHTDLDLPAARAIAGAAAGNPAIALALADPAGRAKLRIILAARVHRLPADAGALLRRAAHGAAASTPDAGAAELVAAGLAQALSGRLRTTSAVHELNIPAAAAPRGRSRRGLTEREHEVLQLVATGATNDHIARCLSVSLATVESHVRSAMHKLKARNRLHAARIVSDRCRSQDA